MASHVPTPSATDNAMAAAMARATAAQGAAAAGTTQTQQATPAAAIPSMTSWDFSSDFGEGEIKTTNNSEYFAVFQEVLAKVTGAGDVRLFEVDNRVEQGWYLSAVVVAVASKDGRVAYTPYLIAGTAQKQLDSGTYRIPNTDRTVPVVRTLDAAFDTEYKTRIVSMLCEAYGIKPDANGIVQGVTTLPAALISARFEFTQNTVLPLLASAIKAGRGALAEQVPQFIDVNVGRLKSGAVVSINVAPVGRGDQYDATGFPHRVDAELTISEQNRAQPQQQTSTAEQLLRVNNVQGGLSAERFATVGMMFDWRMLPPVQMNYATGQAQDLPSKRFIQNVVINSVGLNKIHTTAALMFAISAMPLALDSNRIIPMMWQRNNGWNALCGSGFNPADVGQLNAIANWRGQPGTAGVPLDTSSAAIREIDFIEYMRDITKGVALSIKIPRAGATSQIMSILAAAAEGNKVALEQLTKSLHKMTDGKFGVRFFGQENANRVLSVNDIFSETGNTVFEGRFQQKVGDSTFDLSLDHIDLNAVISRFSKSNPEMITKWVQANMVAGINGGVDPFIRLALRQEVISAYTMDNYDIDQLADVHTFTVRFMETLIACNKDNNLSLQLNFKDVLAGADQGIAAPALMAGGIWTGSVGTAGYGRGADTGVGGAFQSTSVGRF